MSEAATETAAPNLADASAPAKPEQWANQWASKMAAAAAEEDVANGALGDAEGEAEAASEGEAESEAAAAEAAPEKTEAEPADKPPAADASGDVKALHELAKKLGFSVDARAITPSDRAQFRAEKRRWHEQTTAREREFAQKYRAAIDQLGPAAEAKQAWEEGDFDTALKKAFDIDVSELNKRYADRLRNKDPRIDKLEKELQAEREDRQRREAQQRQIEQQLERQRAEANYKREVAAQLTAAEMREVKDLATNEQFVNLVLEKQREHWDGSETISVHEAAELATADLRDAYENLHKVFGDRGTVESPESQSASAGAARSSSDSARNGKAKKPPTNLSTRRAAEASAPGGVLSEREWNKKYATLLRQASD